MLAKIIFLLLCVPYYVTAKECDKNEDCDMEGSICSNGLCVCPPTFIADSLNTKCLPVTYGYGSSCVDNVQCSHSLNHGGVCENNICICTKGYHYFLGECWKTSGLGERCKRDVNCFVSNDFEASKCSDDKVCVCSPNYYQREYSSCRRESYKVGDPCGIYLDCQFENAVCTMERKCQFKTNLIADIDTFNDTFLNFNTDFSETEMILKSKVGDDCKTNNDCPENADCNESHKCSCQKGYYTTDKSRCNPELGGRCKGDSDCLGKNTQCRNGTVCVCKQGFVTSYNGQYCDKMSRDIGWSCLRDEQCGFFGPNSICVKKKCQCNDKSYFIKDKLYCWIKKSVEESCIKNEDCGGTAAVSCIDNKCKCAVGSHPSSDKSTCRKDIITVGESCVENVDCVFDNSECNNSTKKCECLHSFFNKDGKCVQGVGSVCTKAEDCYAEGTLCKDGLCRCKDNFTASEDYSKCLPIIRNLVDSCSESSQCSEIEGDCINGHCQCSNSSHFVDEWQCFISRKINEPCNSFGNCSYIKNSHCYKGLCKCQFGYQLQEGGNVCSGAAQKYNLFTIIIVLISSYVAFKNTDYKQLVFK